MRDLKSDLEICEKATPGPWATTYGNEFVVQDKYDKEDCRQGICKLLHKPKRKEDSEFIAVARTGWPEAIERAIKAEKLLASHAPEGHNITNEQYQRLREDAAALREENDLQRDSIQNLSAQVAGLREALKNAVDVIEMLHPVMNPKEACVCYDAWLTGNKLLLEPDAGAEIMERMKKLEAVAEAVKSIDEWEDDGKDYGSVLFPQELYYSLMDALDALEGSADE